jgi:hypothetical protein
LLRLLAGWTAPKEGLYVCMPDRKRVVYKTPAQRFLEFLLIFSAGLAAAVVWRQFIPDISPSYIVVVTLALGWAIVPFLGTAYATYRGAPEMTREERTRRYLDEIRPIGPYGGHRMTPARMRRDARGLRRL